MKNKRVMVFGVFDGCHEGHKYFLNRAKKLGNRLIVVVTRDDMVNELKDKIPKNTIDDRISAIKALGVATEIISGDKQQNNWDVIRKYKPDVIACGYDQQKLCSAIEKYRDILPATHVQIIGKYQQ